MQPSFMPRHLDDQMTILVWPADERRPVLACLIVGVLINQKLICLGVYANPVRYRTGIHLSIALRVVPLFCLSLPINVPPVLIPVWLLAAAGTAIIIVANARRRM